MIYALETRLEELQLAMEQAVRQSREQQHAHDKERRQLQLQLQQATIQARADADGGGAGAGAGQQPARHPPVPDSDYCSAETSSASSSPSTAPKERPAPARPFTARMLALARPSTASLASDYSVSHYDRRQTDAYPALTSFYSRHAAGTVITDIRMDQTDGESIAGLDGGHETDSLAETDAGTGTDSDTDAEPMTSSERAMENGAGTGTGTDADTDTGTETETETETKAKAKIVSTTTARTTAARSGRPASTTASTLFTASTTTQLALSLASSRAASAAPQPEHARPLVRSQSVKAAPTRHGDGLDFANGRAHPTSHGDRQVYKHQHRLRPLGRPQEDIYQSPLPQAQLRPREGRRQALTERPQVDRYRRQTHQLGALQRPRSQSQWQAQPLVQFELQPQPQAQARARLQVQLQAQAQSQVQSEAQSEAQAPAQSEAQSRAQALAQAPAQSPAQAPAQAPAHTRTHSRPRSQSVERGLAVVPRLYRTGMSNISHQLRRIVQTQSRDQQPQTPANGQAEAQPHSADVAPPIPPPHRQPLSHTQSQSPPSSRPMPASGPWSGVGRHPAPLRPLPTRTQSARGREGGTIAAAKAGPAGPARLAGPTSRATAAPSFNRRYEASGAGASTSSSIYPPMMSTRNSDPAAARSTNVVRSTATESGAAAAAVADPIAVGEAPRYAALPADAQWLPRDMFFSRTDTTYLR